MTSMHKFYHSFHERTCEAKKHVFIALGLVLDKIPDRGREDFNFLLKTPRPAIQT